MSESNEFLLWFAAKAAQLEDRVEIDGTSLVRSIGRKTRIGCWNPLENTDEALALASMLGMSVTFGSGNVCVNKNNYAYLDGIGDGLNASLRRSIVRVAAHMGGLL